MALLNLALFAVQKHLEQKKLSNNLSVFGFEMGIKTDGNNADIEIL